MSDWPPEILGYRGYGPLSTAGEGSPVADALAHAGQTFFTAAAWGTANTATYIPIIVGATTTVYRLAWINGATVNGNADAGLYDRNGNRLVSVGGVAQTGASVPQVSDIADTVLTPGLYYMGMASDSATATFNHGGTTVSSPLLRACGATTQVNAYPLPTTATFGGFAFGFACPLLMGSTESAAVI